MHILVNKYTAFKTCQYLPDKVKMVSGVKGADTSNDIHTYTYQGLSPIGSVHCIHGDMPACAEKNQFQLIKSKGSATPVPADK